MVLRLNKTASDRFWCKVDKSGDCWLWTARRDKNGYGRFRPDGANTGDVGAHRVAFALAGQTVKDGDLVCHTCDNPPCVRPSHLFIGTPMVNAIDRDAKGRGRPWPMSDEVRSTRARGERSGRYTHPESTPRGSTHGNATITEDDVRAIRAAVASGESQGSVARRMGLTQPNVSRIVLRKAWTHVV